MKSTAQPQKSASPLPQNKPIALVVLLENVGHIAGLQLPQFVMSAIDFLTEEYAKFLLRIHSAYSVYDTVEILEDQLATGPHLTESILRLSQRYRVDLLLLVHGKEGTLIGHQGKQIIGGETFGYLRAVQQKHREAVDLRMVYGLNCYGVTLMDAWRRLGAQVVNGSPGVNWLPEPSLSEFLRQWLGGQPYSIAVERSNSRARSWGNRITRRQRGSAEHPMVASSRQMVYGESDLTVHSTAHQSIS